MATGLQLLYRKKHRFKQVLTRRLATPHIDGEDIVLFLLLVALMSGFMRPRYLLICSPLFAILIARFLSRIQTPWLSVLGLSLLLLYNAREITVAIQNTSPAPYGSLLAFLEQHELTHGYTGYYTAYPVVFLSNEKFRLSPAAGPIVTDRYSAYTRQVDAADRICFVLPTGTRTDSLFRAQLDAGQFGSEQKTVPPWHIYLNIRPDPRNVIPLPIKDREPNGNI